MQRARDAGAVVVAELAHALGHVLEVGLGDRHLGKQDLAARHPRFRLATQVEDDLQQLRRRRALMQRSIQVRRQGLRQQLQLRLPALKRKVASRRKGQGLSRAEAP